MHRGIRDGNLSVDERNRASSLDEQETGAGVLELCHDYRNELRNRRIVYKFARLKLVLINRELLSRTSTL